MSVTDLMEAAGRGDLEGVKRNFSEVGRKDGDGWTALMWAVRGGHANCIPLLEKEIGMQDNWGWTALMWAAYNGRADCVRLLLSEVGKQTIKEWKDFFNAYPTGTTALMMAARRSHPEIVELLLPYEQGLKDSNGHTAKWYANNKGYSTRVCVLLKNEGLERIPPPTSGAAGWRGVRELSSSRSLPEGMTCVICLTNPKDTLLQPCNHLCVCSSCAGRIMNQTCPLCRTPIESTVKVYL
ncbi:Ankyrin repeat protein 2 [Giardia muris]|uniref:Ankyrin repeat protein 2 n=1 Tax=Giardia muris TaxID=5742 RepID=A0A4Z1SWU1_GIAMU|nr:Ankyrin repeat protein 2 [Giardia muris]|eukprot:TNJ26193.1 Ankyrin repeat protein 2 [Giardia muris]